MALRRVANTKLPSLFPRNPNPNTNSNSSAAPAATTVVDVLPFLNSQLRKKLQKKLQSPRVWSIQPDADHRLSHFEAIILRDANLCFITRSKSFLTDLLGHHLPLADVGKLHHELGFPRGYKVSRFTARHPLLLHLPHLPPNSKPYLAFNTHMESLLEEERTLMDAMEPQRVTTVRKLLMLSTHRQIPLAKLHHYRLLFGLLDNFHDRVRKYMDFFRIAVDPNGRHVLELVKWDPALAVNALERDFVPS